MSVPILVCECGMPIKAPGATPGRVGKCPRCGGRLVVPDEPAAASAAVRVKPAVVPEQGYGVTPEAVPAQSGAQSARCERRCAAESVFAERPQLPAPSDGILAPLKEVESNPLASFAYPLRGAECLGVVGALSLAFWVFGVLVPEYCLTLMGDADEMGTPTLGKFIAMISFLPVVFLLPFALTYWLQYLGRVLVSSALGETCPPRSPDRNFDGFTTGLSPWAIWLALGVSVGLAPVVAYWYSLKSATDWNSWIALGLGLFGLPYILMALMLSFLHDDALAAMPWRVSVALMRVFGPFMRRCFVVAAVLGLGIGAFVLALIVRCALLLVLRAHLARKRGSATIDVGRGDAHSRSLLFPPQKHATLASREPALGHRVAPLMIGVCLDRSP